MKILVIPEDFRKDQYILSPIITAMCAHIGLGRAKVQVCRDPLLGGVAQALKLENLEGIIRRYPMIDLFLLCVDRDGLPGRANQLRTLEERLKPVVGERRILLAENAWQELEVWVLAGMRDLQWEWSDVRREINPKELYYESYARSRGCFSDPAQGRGRLSAEAARNYQRIRQLCPEDVAHLESRVRHYIEETRIS